MLRKELLSGAANAFSSEVSSFHFGLSFAILGACRVWDLLSGPCEKGCKGYIWFRI